MCERLGIRIIAANSAQAKGRVERSHGTHQDRLIKKMRRKKIRTHEEANVFLREYLPDHNRRFAKAAARPEDYHRKAPLVAELRNIFRLETERTISNDWVVRYENRWFQVQRQSRHWAPTRAKVTVCEWQDGSIEIHYRGQKLGWTEIQAGQAKPVAQPAPRPPKQRKLEPAVDHPWRKSYQTMRAVGRDRPVCAVVGGAASATP